MHVMRRILGFITMLTVLFLCWSLAYWLTGWFYDWLQLAPSHFVKQIITLFLGFFILGFSIYIVTNIKWVKARQEKFLLPIIQAIKMMAEGNFNIDLSYYRNQFRGKDNKHPYSQI